MFEFEKNIKTVLFLNILSCEDLQIYLIVEGKSSSETKWFKPLVRESNISDLPCLTTSVFFVHGKDLGVGALHV